MKKIASLLLCVVLVIGMIPSFTITQIAVDAATATSEATGEENISSATPYGEYCEHNYYSQLILPTFDTLGHIKYTCTDCGYTYDDYDNYETPVERFIYMILNDEVTIMGYNQTNDESDMQICIPDTIDGYPVTRISDEAFAWNTMAISLKIPKTVVSIGKGIIGGTCISTIDVDPENTVYHSKNNCVIETESKTLILGCESSIIPNDEVTSIGNYAFYYCYNLMQINIPSSITYIGDYAFAYCGCLTEISIPDSVTDMGIGVFSCCDYLESVKLPNHMININDYMFENCMALTNITIPDTVTDIGDYAFSSCLSLSDITIPNSVTLLGRGAFYDCEALTSMVLPPKITTIEYGLFWSCSALTNINIPCDVTVIGDLAFSDCKSLKTIVIPNKVEEIGQSAFSNCSLLKSIEMPDSVTKIGNNAFRACSALTEVVLNEGLETIGTFAFGGTKLTKVVCPSTLETIGVSAFNGVTTLTDVDLANVKYIKGTAFAGCTKLGTTAAGTRIVIPATVTEVAAGAFQNCTGFTRIDWYPVRLTSGAAGNKTNPAFQGCTGLKTVRIYQTAEYVPSYLFYKTGQITSLSFYGEPIVKEIGDYAFFQARIGTVTFPASLQKIGRESFRNCNLLKIVNFGTGVQSIGQLAFSFSNNLETVTIPGNVKTIYAYAFRGCSKLKTVVLEEGVDYISSYAFMSTALESITLPASITKINSGLTYNTSAEIHYYEGTYVDQYLHSVAAKIKNETLVPIV